MYLISKFKLLGFKQQHKFSRILAGFIALAIAIATAAPSISQGSENYGEALQKSILFYEAQQTGKLPEWNRFPWRGDSTLGDGAKEGADLSGGWIDAGDNVKFNYPMAFSVTTLAWGGIEYYDAYQKSGQLTHLSQNIKWVTDYLLNSFTNDKPGEYELYAQVGDAHQDHNWWGSVEVVHYEMERPALKIDTTCPGSDLAAETSAALASSSILFRQNGDLEYADLLVDKAEKLFDFANNYRGKYSDCLLDQVEPFYKSNNGNEDEIVWGAAWLHKAKKAQDSNYSREYLAIAEAEYEKIIKPFDYTFQYDDKSYGIFVLLATETGKEEYQNRAEAWLDYWTVGHQGKKIQYTPGGLAFLAEWGSLPLSANTSFVAFIYSDWLETQGEADKSQRYFDFAVSQIDYILGQNPAQRSYMIGYGDDYPQNPHHRTAHGSWLGSVEDPVETQNELTGALVGGPDEQDQWQDERNDWIKNEVGVSYNAGLTGALAKMYAEFGGEPLAELSFPSPEESEIYVESKLGANNNKMAKVNLAIINKSNSPAKGIENPILRVFYTIDSEAIANTATSVTTKDCPQPSSKVVKLKQNAYYSEVSCGGTVIYPGGYSDFQKQLTLNIDLNRPNSNGLFSGLGGMFTKPVKIEKICLYDGEELIWESGVVPLSTDRVR